MSEETSSSEVKPVQVNDAWPEEVVEKEEPTAIPTGIENHRHVGFMELCKSFDSLGKELVACAGVILNHPQFKRTPLRAQIQSALHLHEKTAERLIRVGINFGFITVVPRGTQPTERGKDPAPQEKTPED